MMNLFVPEDNDK